MKLNIGDKVILDDSENANGDWSGMTGTVIALFNDGVENMVKIDPDFDRPDGHKRIWFYWPFELTNKVSNE